MALKDDKIKDLFSSGLRDYEPEVPASVWSGIDQLLSQQPPVESPDLSSELADAGAKSAGKASSLKTILIAVGVTVATATGVFLYYNSEDTDIPVVKEDVHQAEEYIEPTIIHDEVEEAEAIKVLQPSDFSRSQTTSPIAEPLEENIAEELEAETVITSTEPGKISEVVEVESQILSVDEIEELPPLPKFLKEDIAFSIKINAGALSSNVNEKGGGILFSKQARSQELIDFLKEENADYELSHNQPLSVGLTVSKKLSKRFSIETGLMFTYLSSKIRSYSGVNLNEEQSFGYLGIPIYVNYNLYELGKANFYLSLGMSMQKDIFGKYTSKLLIDKSIPGIEWGDINQIIYTEPAYLKKNISQSHWQFATNFAVGASYPIYRRLFIFSSVGGVYYFDANNEYRTIFSDRKFQLDLNLGLKIEF